MRRILVAVAVVLCACGSSTPSTAPTPSAPLSVTTSANTPAPPTATPSPSPAAATLDVPSLHLHATLVQRPCTDYQAAGVPLPDASLAWFMDCTSPPCVRAQPCGFYAVIASESGVLSPLGTAPASTEVHIVTPAGAALDRIFDAGGGHSARNADGTWPGHGVPPGGPLFVAIRGASSQTERGGYPPPG